MNVEVQYEVKISGRVQGVGFRYYVKERADKFNIRGWVKNLSDGSVGVTACGEEVEMESFLDHLRRGPSLARVTHIAIHKISEPVSFDDFSVKY